LFTGIVEEVGWVSSLRRRREGLQIVVAAKVVSEALRPGDSLSVNGVCQTVEEVEKGQVSFTAVPETLRSTTLGKLRRGQRVNLERALALGSPLGGHIVQGHVDGVGRVVALKSQGQERMLTVRLPRGLGRGVVPKGSIAIDGVSLTVASLRGDLVSVALVPYTLEHTTAGSYRPGTEVNVELDVLGKYASGGYRSGGPGLVP